jgi:predicted permease
MPEPRRFDWRADVRARLADLSLTPEAEAHIVDEVAQHLDEQYMELSARMDPTDARERLLAELRQQSFDHVAHGRRRPSRARRLGMRLEALGGIRRDIAHAVRSLARSPGVAIPGIVALALGIGLTSAMFSVVYSTLIKGLPFRDSARIAMVTHVDSLRPADQQDWMYFGDFDAYRSRQRSFRFFGAYSLGNANVTGGDRPDRLGVARVTADALDLTAVRPFIGRSISAADEVFGAPLVAVIGAQTWRERFAADSLVIGKPIRLNGRVHTIVGVMPDGFAYLGDVQVWIPLRVDRATARNDGPGVSVIGQLRRGTTMASANAELRAIAAVIARERADSTAERLRPFVQSVARTTIRGQVFSLMYAMLAAVGLVLIVACSNVANLLLHRAAERSKEIGVLAALGASRGAIIRRALVESSLIAAAGAAVGMLIAVTFIRVYNHAIPANQRPYWMDIQLYPPVLAFTAIIAAGAGVLAGVLPAIQSARIDLSAILKDDVFGVATLRIGRLSRGVIIAEIAVASAMLVAAGFITRSIVTFAHIETGFRTDGIVSAQITLSTADSVRRRSFFADLDRLLAESRDVHAYEIGSGVPGTGWSGGAVEIAGRTYTRTSRRPGVRRLSVSEGFFPMFGVKLLRGRGITAADRDGAERVAVVSESFAARVLRGGDPIGARIRFADGESDAGEWMTIVGVMPTLYGGSMDNNAFPAEVLTAYRQEPARSSAVVAMVGDDAVASLRKLVASLDAEAPVYDVASLDTALTQSLWHMRLFGGTFVVFGVLAIVLAAIGLYAVMAFSVSRRVREIGIRLALGASRVDVVRMIFRGAALTIGVGMTAGLLLGLMFARALSSVLFGVSATDPAVLAIVAAVLATVAMVACLVPAHRATRLDPVVALRAD